MEGRRDQSALFAAWAVPILIAPGIVFALAVVANEWRLRTHSDAVLYIGSSQTYLALAGAIGLVTTPLALMVAWLNRATLPGLVKALVGLAVLGLGAFILMYVWDPWCC